MEQYWSNTTLYPASQNFLVDISEACDSPGTMCALVTSSGNHGISKFPTCVEYNIVPLGILIAIGFSAGRTFTNGAPSTIKCPLAPESEIANSTCLTKVLVLKIASAFGNFLYPFACTRFNHACAFVLILL